MNTVTHEQAEHLARKRASARLGWALHALVFVTVNAALAALSYWRGHDALIVPALGWAVGLLVHGIAVTLLADGNGLHQRLLQKERQRLADQRDPW